MPAFSPKIVEINNVAFAIVQNSLKTKQGNPDVKVRTAVVGKSTTQINSIDLETAVSTVMFDIITTDTDDNNDPRQLIKTWKQNGNLNSIIITPDGPGQNQYYGNMSLINDPEINESPDGVISLEWKGKQVQLS